MTTPLHVTASELEQFAHRLADASGPAVLPMFRRNTAVQNKSISAPGAPGAGHAEVNMFDPVTEADRAAERVMREMIAARFPDHGIVGEEFGSERADAEYCWVLDPIDGTRAFILGLPIWGTLIGLLHRGKPVLGMMDQPFTRERFWASEGKGWFRGPDGTFAPLVARACAGMETAHLSTTHPDMFKAGAEIEGFARLKRAAQSTRFGGDCYAYCLLAAGHIDLIAEAGLKPYDIVALIPIIEAAGGRVTAWDGGPAAAGGRVLASGDARVHAAALGLLRQS